MKRVSILGATGSIGQSTIDLIRRAGPDVYDIVALTGGRNVQQLARDAAELKADCVVTAYPECLSDLQDALAGSGIACAAGADALCEAAQRPADWVMSAIVGAAGLAPGLAALKHCNTLALANKESLVCAGPLLMDTARAAGTAILPVDSEHSAIFQALRGEDQSTVERVIITASGGAFRDWPTEQLASATPEQALAHPNWDMGARITIDSASLFNKAMELIEAHVFFEIPPEQIEAMIHPESLVHALVGFRDGGIIAHLGAPDMRHAIGYALHCPKREALPVPRLDLAQISTLTFQAPDEQRHPALRLAREVMEAGGLFGTVFNAAKEQALDGFIAREIRFTDMAGVVETVMAHMAGTLPATPDWSLDTVLAVDAEARAKAQEAITVQSNKA